MACSDTTISFQIMEFDQFHWFDEQEFEIHNLAQIQELLRKAIK